MTDKIHSLLKKIEAAEMNPVSDCVLPQNAYYLSDHEILCKERLRGNSRYPYDADGLVLWAHSNGVIEACESAFHIFKPIDFCKDPSLCFFGGIEGEDGTFEPISLFETTRQLKESIAVKRSVVYSNRSVYYLADTAEVTFALRVHTDPKKHIHFAFYAENKTDAPKTVYLFSVIDTILRRADTETFWDKLSKFGYRRGNAYLLRTHNDCLVVNRKIEGGRILRETHTVGKSDLIANRKTILNAPCLTTATFSRESDAVSTTDLPVAADLIVAKLAPHASMREEFDLSYYHDIPSAEAVINAPVDLAEIDAALDTWTAAENAEFDRMKITYGDWKGSLPAGLLNRFLRTVQKQVSVCALGKNYAGPFLGTRDVIQQLESCLMWSPELSREKILRTLNFVLEDGRPPRQFTLPESDDQLPRMDLREYIDQGAWIISALYSYLSFTDDYSILDELCSYYVADADTKTVFGKSAVRDTVLDHAIKIMEYYGSILDPDTGCVRILFGDWNDAIDALGATDDPNKKYGSGVSLMVTFQVYRNCLEMIDILRKVGKHTDLIPTYEAYREGIERGVFAHGIETDENGDRRIVHGWGDKLSYKLGSLCDPDGVSRLSSTSTSYFVLSGLIEKDPTLKKDVRQTFDALTSKYGLLTFDKPFPLSVRDKVGRICIVTPGTYENCASYVHAGMFAEMSLFAIGESEMAWRELEHSVVISHDNCSMTPFVMPNSYCHNPEYGIDGESMGDWYTGSGTVLLKEVVRYGFGVQPDLDGLTVAAPKQMNTTKAELELSIKGHPMKITYTDAGKGQRTYLVDGKETSGTYDPMMDTVKLRLPTADLHNGMTITILD